MSSSIYLAIPLTALLAVIQAAALPRFPILGQQPVLLLLLVVSWGLLRGAEEGVVWAFVAGFMSDLFSVSPLGTTSVALMVAVLAAAFIQQNLPISRYFLPIILIVLGTVIYLFVYLILLRVLGFPVGVEAAASLPTLILIHSILILPIYWSIYSLLQLIRPRPVEV